MDRLSTLTCASLAAALALGACDEKPSERVGREPARRTDGAKVAATQGATTEAFCDRHSADDRGPAFRWPELAGGAAAPGAAPTWRWINVWATWCKPCIEEMPRLVAWRDRLRKAGHPVELSFISVDDSDDAVAAFRKDHPDTPPSTRVAGADQRTRWLQAMGLDDSAIPIQLFVSPANHLRCTRAGGIRDKDYDLVARLFTE